VITQLENQLDRDRRMRHLDRVEYATACLLREFGYRVTYNKPQKPGMTRTGIYRIDGVKGEFRGVPAVCEWLFEKGHQVRTATLTHWLSDGEATVGGYTIRRVGIAKREHSQKWVAA